MWYTVSAFGMAELWAGISLGLVVLYLVLRQTAWRHQTQHTRNRIVLKRVALLLLVSLTLTYLLTFALKVGIQQDRPCIVCEFENQEGCNPYCPHSYSFPSGHASIIFSAAAVGFLLIRRKEALLLFVPAFIVAYSRLELGVHLPAEVAAGALLGTVCTFVVWKILKDRTMLLG